MMGCQVRSSPSVYVVPKVKKRSVHRERLVARRVTPNFRKVYSYVFPVQRYAFSYLQIRTTRLYQPNIEFFMF
jgi:hypothetical protein